MPAALWRVLLALNVVALALLAISVPFQRPESGARVVTLVSLAFIVASLLGLAVVIRTDWDPF